MKKTNKKSIVGNKKYIVAIIVAIIVLSIVLISGNTTDSATKEYKEEFQTQLNLYETKVKKLPSEDYELFISSNMVDINNLIKDEKKIHNENEITIIEDEKKELYQEIYKSIKKEISSTNNKINYILTSDKKYDKIEIQKYKNKFNDLKKSQDYDIEKAYSKYTKLNSLKEEVFQFQMLTKDSLEKEEAKAKEDAKK